MHPFNECPEWEYQHDPHHAQILASESATVLQKIVDNQLTVESAMIDTRPTHRDLFARLVPAKTPYLAGNYRGQNFKCLKYRPVRIAGNPLVGSDPKLVATHLKAFAKHARATIKGLDKAIAVPNSQLPIEEKIKFAVAAACALFSEFLVIHPYANGNGHIARILITWFLAHFDLWLDEFPIEPRPADPPYSEVIFRYQNGDIEPFERMILLALGSGPT